MKTSLLILFALIGPSAFCQKITPEKIGFRAHRIHDKSMGTIDYYVSSGKADQRKPVLLYLDGSGAYPLFQFTDRGIGSTVPLDYRNLSNEFHIVLISKPGVPFIDSVGFDSATGYPLYRAPDEYSQRLSLDWRVKASSQVLKEVMNEYKTDKSKIAVLGISEGFQVGAKLASENKAVTHLAILVGNGLNQFYDFIIQNRSDAEAGILPASVAQHNIDSLYTAFKSIYASPTATDKNWLGHTYLRWASFCMNNPTENIMHISIPVLIVAASNDRNSAVLGTDYLYLESIRAGKTNITYNVYPYDHGFNEEVKDATGTVVSRTNHTSEIVQACVDWIRKH